MADSGPMEPNVKGGCFLGHAQLLVECPDSGAEISAELASLHPVRVTEMLTASSLLMIGRLFGIVTAPWGVNGSFVLWGVGNLWSWAATSRSDR